jgi:type IV pilus assembly protein PilQ
MKTVNISKQLKSKAISLRHTLFYSFVAKCLILSLFVLLILPVNSHSDTSVYTLQIGTFLKSRHADTLFDHTASILNNNDLDYLRIEKIQKYYAVRLGKFDGRSEASIFREAISPDFDDIVLMKANIKGENIIRTYHDASSAEHAAVFSYTPPQPSGKANLWLDKESAGENILDADKKKTNIQKTNIQKINREDQNNKKIKVIENEDRLSLSVQDAEIKSILKALSIKKKLNIVADKDVTGKISVHLENLALNEVLDAIIPFNGFNYVQRDEIIYVTKADKSKVEDLQKTDVMVFKLNYVDMDEIEKVVSKLVSESSKITFYRPEKTLIIEDKPENIVRVKKVLDRLDIPPKQVLIETRIMSVRLNDDSSLGIDWNDTFSGFFNSSGNILTDGFTSGTGQGFFFNVINSDFNLFLDALQNKTEVSFLSTPRVLALDNKEASIIIGDKLGYFVTTATEAAVLQSVEFLDTGTQLYLTPHITDDGKIIMEIHPEISDGSVINGLPSKNTTEVTTSLMAPDGGTIFIGGLIRDRKEDVYERVPGLGSIPIFGALFGKTTNITIRNEIIVLITPHIISAGNTEVFEKDMQKVQETAETLKKERSLKELFPGTKKAL